MPKEFLVVGLLIGVPMGMAAVLLVQVIHGWWAMKKLIREFRRQMACGTTRWLA